MLWVLNVWKESMEQADSIVDREKSLWWSVLGRAGVANQSNVRDPRADGRALYPSCIHASGFDTVTL